MKHNLPQWEARYARLRAQFNNLGWISEGYVQNRGPGAGGPCYQWTRKVNGVTRTRLLSAAQMARYRSWFENARQVRSLARELEALSLDIAESVEDWG